jgi:hypothetical protein
VTPGFPRTPPADTAGVIEFFQVIKEQVQRSDASNISIIRIVEE